MQIVSKGDNLHELSKPIFWGNKYFKMLSAENFTQQAVGVKPLEHHHIKTP